MNKCSYINMSLDKEDIKWEKKKRRTTIITSMERAAAAVMTIIVKNTSIITAMLQIIYREKFIL